MSQPTFDPSKVPPDDLVALHALSFCAALADGDMERDQLLIIFQGLDLQLLDEARRIQVRAFAAEPPALEPTLTQLAAAGPELRQGAILRAVEVLLADDLISSPEQAFLDAAAARLSATPEQVVALEHFVQESRRVAREGLDPNTAERVLKEAASGLAAVGVPLAAVYFGGSVVGLSAAGITSGLAFLGLGLGMFTGIGVAVAIGAGIFFGVRKLLGDSKQETEQKQRAERERRVQLIVQNLQETINALLERIASLERQAFRAAANAEAIALLRARLDKIRRILAVRQEQAGVTEAA